MEPLRPLVGEWRIETSLAPPGSVRARARFEWALGGRFLLQHSEVDLPEAPDGLCVIAADPTAGDTCSTTSTPAGSSGCTG